MSTPILHTLRRAGSFDRREFLRDSFGAAALGAATLWLPGCASVPSGATPATTAPGDFERAAAPALAGLRELAALDARNGGAAPAAVPWLDKNGSFNQPPGPNQELSNIFHFAGRVARSNGFTGMGTDGHGRRLPFGTNTTDSSFMQGRYWAGRAEHTGLFAHT